MENLQIVSLENTDISTWDFSVLKAELQEYLSQYEGLVYTEETVKDAKKDRTTLNKAKKVVDDARKVYKARCLEPYEAIEPKIKELTELIEERRRQIDDTVKDFERRSKEEKEKEVREYYDRISECFGTNADRIYQKIFDPKWTNASTGISKYREAVQIVVASVRSDLDRIAALDTPFGDTLRETYLETLSMDAVLQKDSELKEAAGKAGLTESERPVQVNVSSSSTVPDSRPIADENEGTLVRIHASQPRLNQICDFMKVIGVEYEIL